MPPLSHFYYFQAHANAQRGFYFDAVSEPLEGVYAASSNLIEDPYWNYCYLGEGASLSEADLPKLASHLPVSNRKLSLLLPAAHHLLNAAWFPQRFTEFSGDTWMVATTPRQDIASAPEGLTVELITTEAGIDAACAVFDDAYLSPASDGIGYSALPPAYTTAFRRGLMRASQFGSLHAVGHIQREPVAIASCYFTGRSAGIYNVAVTRAARQKGFGSAISQWIFERAKSFGAVDVFLQTEPESKVQEMYSRLGFEVLTRGTVFTIND